MILRCDLLTGYTCNNKCLHCFNPDKINDLRKAGKPLDKSTDELKGILRQAKKTGIMELLFSGGEISIRPDFEELIIFAHRLGFKIGVQTNGRAFCSRELSEKILRIDNEISFTVPFNHTTPRIFEDISGVRGSFNQTLQGICNLKDSGAKRIILKMVILNQNYEDLPNFVNLTRKLELSELNFTFVQPTGNSGVDWAQIMPTYTKVQPYLIKAMQMAEGLKFECYDIPFCFLTGYEKHAIELGLYVFPELSNDSIERISDKRENLLSDFVLHKRKKTKKCNGCKFYGICLGVWEEYLHDIGDSEFAPVEGKPIRNLSDLRELISKSK